MTGQPRCATYARYSSDRQREASIVDQQRNMIRYAEAHGWRIDPDLMFSDEAVSGTGLDRPGFQALLRATRSTPRCIDIVLVDDTSRISRSLADSVRLREDLNFRGIRFIAVSQGIDSDDDQSEVMMTVHSLVDSLYIKELAKKTHRGLEGLALAGFHTGGSCFGYQSVRFGDKTRLRIDDRESGIVRRIFEMSAVGFSLKKIARQLDEEGVGPPRGTRRKTKPGWAHTAIREMLRRDLYRGRIVWNRRKYKKKPGTNKRISVPRPESEWVITERPELRIVSEELWDCVQTRIRETAANYPGVKPGLLQRAATVPYLFSGILKCGECGANLAILTGRGKEGKRASYGCPRHFNRGMCSNNLYQRRDQLERTLLSGLQNALLEDAALGVVVSRVSEALRSVVSRKTGALRELNAKRSEIQREMNNLAAAICKSGGSAFLVSTLQMKEAELKSLDQTLDDRTPNTATSFSPKELRNRIMDELSDLSGLLNADPVRAKAELLRHVNEIRMVPAKGAGGRFYLAQGEWDMLPPANTDRNSQTQRSA